jgi:hypothetical protein
LGEARGRNPPKRTIANLSIRPEGEGWPDSGQDVARS